MKIIQIDLDSSGTEGIAPNSQCLYLPETVHEMKLKDYVQYNIALSEAPSFVVKSFNLETSEKQDAAISKWTPLEWQEYHIFVANAVTKLLFVEDSQGNKKNVDLLTLLGMKKGSPFFIDEQSADSLFALYATLNSVIVNFQPEEAEYFVHKGQRFKVPGKFVDNYGRTTYAPNITTIEAIEALQIEHAFSNKNEEGEFYFKDKFYHTDLGIMACICRKCDEQGNITEALPLNMQERSRFIQNRMKFFEDIPVDIALNVDFFLTCSKRILLKTRMQELRLKTLVLIGMANRQIGKLPNFGDGMAY